MASFHPSVDVDEAGTVAALRRGDEAAFVALVERYNGALTRLAMNYVASRTVAEEVVQETWLGVLQGIDRFEERSSFKTWLFRILVNRAKRRGEREHRTVPFSTFGQMDTGQDEPAVASEQFLPPGHQQAGHWAVFPQPWETLPEERMLSGEMRQYIETAIAALPAAQRQVITLRDVEGWQADDVCNVLQLTETNQRVLLHRARSKVRRALEQYLTGD
jgi:RNA polymerase sigma-70 factor, ECF subfamily